MVSSDEKSPEDLPEVGINDLDTRIYVATPRLWGGQSRYVPGPA